MEINKMLTISSTHIKPETWKTLENEPPFEIVVYNKECEFGLYGFFILVIDSESCNAPEDLAACMRFAEDHDCAWLCLDTDGEVLPELPTYEERY